MCQGRNRTANGLPHPLDWQGIYLCRLHIWPTPPNCNCRHSSSSLSPHVVQSESVLAFPTVYLHERVTILLKLPFFVTAAHLSAAKMLVYLCEFSQTIFSLSKFISAPLPSLVGAQVKISGKICRISNPRIMISLSVDDSFSFSHWLLLLHTLRSLPNVTSNEAWALSQLSSGFCGYESRQPVGGFENLVVIRRCSLDSRPADTNVR